MTATVTPLHSRLTAADYEAERAAIREMYGDSKAEAGAKRDQALAKLFYRSGWTQEELGKKEGKGQQWISRHLRFGAFLNFTPSGVNLEKLSEGRFRDYWGRTDKTEVNERIRFGQVVKLIEASTLAAPRHPPIRHPIIAKFADGKWHRSETMAKRLEVTAAQVDAVLNEMAQPARQENSHVKVERRRHGTGWENRIFKRDATVSVDELIEEFTPLVDELQTLSRNPPGTIPSTVLGHIAARFRNLLKKWRE